MNNNKSDKRYIKAGIGYTIANYFIKGLSFITLPIYVRLMSTADYGNFNTYLAYESMLAVVLGLALHASLKMQSFAIIQKWSLIIIWLRVFKWEWFQQRPS